MRTPAIAVVAVLLVVLTGCGSGGGARPVPRTGSVKFVNGAFEFHGAVPADWYKELGVKIGTPASAVRARFGRPVSRNHDALPGLTCWWYPIRGAPGDAQGFCMNVANRVRRIIGSVHG
jgi:hypothetical protein